MSGRKYGIAAIGIALLVCGAARDAPGAVGRDSGATSSRDAGALARGFSAAARAIAPAVVRIDVGRAPQPQLQDDGPSAAASRVSAGSSAVSGVLIDTLGHVVTSAAAVAGARSLSIVTQGGRRLPAYLRGVDLPSGVAVVAVEGRPPPDLQAARFGDSDLVDIGQWVLALGRRSDATEAVSAGIVSGRFRRAPASPISAAVGTGGALVIDAILEAAAAGGPIVTLDGEVIALAVSAPRFTAAPTPGPGRGIPINQVRRVAQMIVAAGETQYPYIGVVLTDVGDLGARGALVSRVVAGAPAARAGLRPGDVITTVDNLETRVAEDVVDRVSYHEIGDSVTLGFVREGRERSAQVAVAALPSVSPPSLAASSSVRVSTSWVISAGAPRRMGGPQ